MAAIHEFNGSGLPLLSGPKKPPGFKQRAAPLLPALAGLRRAAVGIAFAVGEQAPHEGLCVTSSPESLRDAISSSPWAPVYTSYL